MDYQKPRINKLGALLTILPVIYTMTILAGEANDRGLSFSLQSSYHYNDNVTLSATNPVDAYLFQIRPEVAFLWGSGPSEYSLSIVNETAKFDGSSEDNYSDTFVDFSANVVMTSKHRFVLDLGMADAHQARGQDFSIGVGNSQQDVDTYSQSEYGLSYLFGRESARAQLGIYYSFQDLDYDERREVNGIDRTRVQDLQTTVLGANFSYELGSKTDIVVDISQSEFDYDIETGFGNTVDAILVGISWEASSKTSGTIQAGTQSRDLVSGQSNDSNIWLASILWAPNTSALLQLSSSKAGEASIGVGNSRDVATTSLSWTHTWTSRWQSVVDYSLEDTDFIGTDVSMDSSVFSINIDYTFDDSISASFFMNYADRDSNDIANLFSYDQSIYGVNLRLEFM